MRAPHEKEYLLKLLEKSAQKIKRMETAAEHAAASNRARQHADTLRRMASGT